MFFIQNIIRLRCGQHITCRRKGELIEGVVVELNFHRCYFIVQSGERQETVHFADQISNLDIVADTAPKSAKFEILYLAMREWGKVRIRHGSQMTCYHVQSINEAENTIRACKPGTTTLDASSEVVRLSQIDLVEPVDWEARLDWSPPRTFTEGELTRRFAEARATGHRLVVTVDHGPRAAFRTHGAVESIDGGYIRIAGSEPVVVAFIHQVTYHDPEAVNAAA